MLIATEIAVTVTAPLPQSSGSAASSAAQSNTQTDSQNTQGQAGNVSGTTQDSAPSSNTANTNASGNTSQGQGSSFSKLLDAQGQSDTNTSTSGNAPASTPPSNNSSSQTNNNNSGNGSSTDSGEITMSLVALLTAQAGNAVNAADAQPVSALTGNGNTDTTSSQNANTPAPGNNLLALLTDLLQQLAGELSAGSQQNTSTTDATDTAQTQTTNAGNASENSSPQGDALAQLAALLQQILPQLQAAAAPSATSQQGSVTDATSSTGGSSGTGPSLQDLLAQLNQTLSDALNANNNGAVTGQDSGNAGGNTQTPASFLFADFLISTPQTQATSDSADDTSDNTMQPAGTLQTLLSDIINLITTNTAKPDAAAPVPANSNAAASGTSGSNGNTPIAVPTAPQPQADASSATFAKFVATAQASPPPVADQVLVQIKSAAASGISQIRIQLEPADLGKVEVQMMTGPDGKTGVTFTADNRNTLSMLQNEARSLEAALRDIGLKTDAGSLSFNLRGDGQQNQGNFKKGNYTQVAAIGEDDDMDLTGSVTAMYSLTVQDGLDIQV